MDGGDVSAEFVCDGVAERQEQPLAKFQHFGLLHVHVFQHAAPTQQVVEGLASLAPPPVGDPEVLAHAQLEHCKSVGFDVVAVRGGLGWVEGAVVLLLAFLLLTELFEDGDQGGIGLGR